MVYAPSKLGEKLMSMDVKVNVAVLHQTTMYLVAPFSVVTVSFGDINLFIDFFEIVYNLPKS